MKMKRQKNNGARAVKRMSHLFDHCTRNFSKSSQGEEAERAHLELLVVPQTERNERTPSAQKDVAAAREVDAPQLLPQRLFAVRSHGVGDPRNTGKQAGDQDWDLDCKNQQLARA